MLVGLAIVALALAHLPDYRHHSEQIDGVLSFDLTRVAGEHSLSRRANTSSASLANQQAWWGLTLAIGTPPQLVLLQLDTGSSDLWVAGSCSGFGCTPDATFNHTLSSTFVGNTSDLFQISYQDGTGAEGFFCQDTVSPAKGITIEHANFAYADFSDSMPSVLGVGLVDNEALSPGQTKYANMPIQLKQQGYINTAAYSLWLDAAVEAGTGVVLFGGIDESKFVGPLQTVPLVASLDDPESQLGIPFSSSTAPREFMVALHGMSTSNGTRSSPLIEVSYPALLDSGTTNIMFPGDMGNQVAERLGATWDPVSQQHLIACNAKGSLSFNFSDIVIPVPIAKLIDPLSPVVNGTCVLGFGYESETLVLGDRFLSATYVVYDIDHREISLAPARPAGDAGTPKIKPILNSVPGAHRAPLYTHTQVSTGYSYMSTTSVASQNNTSQPTGVHAASHATSHDVNKQPQKNGANPGHKSALFAVMAAILGLM